MSETPLQTVSAYRALIQDLLVRAAKVKPDNNVEPPLTEADLGGEIWRLPDTAGEQVTNHAAVETAFREKFYELLATTTIDDPAFINIWNLLDIVSIFSDNEQCEPALFFWLIEELLDSQTIDGCRKVFDYLESRREISTAKHFKQKSLVILRSCNELLRRLSRAEDTVFCGRVFIYLFQSFPLGDKSSVNLRGEFHTENVTTFDEISKKLSEEDRMEIDGGTQGETTETEPTQTTEGQSNQENAAQTKEAESKAPTITVSDKDAADKPQKPDLDALYPVFWGLQGFFSSPTRLFNAENFAAFRNGLEQTLAAFKLINTDLDTRSAKGTSDLQRGLKRKRNGDAVDISSSFNPKYLTSRELFDLEVNDIAFRRHVLVQALILLDFILSLTPEARSRLPKTINKAVVYNYVVSDEDAKWAAKTRNLVAEYLQQGADGKFYYRMVDTVLSRDKNWVRWKIENCPPIERPPVTADDYANACEAATKEFADRKLTSSSDLNFLAEEANMDNLERLKDRKRFETPAPEDFMKRILDDDFDIDMAQTEEDKEDAMRARASKVWRILRLTSRGKLGLFDKIDDGKNIDVLFKSPEPAEDEKKVSDGDAGSSRPAESTTEEKSSTEPTGKQTGTE